MCLEREARTILKSKDWAVGAYDDWTGDGYLKRKRQLVLEYWNAVSLNSSEGPQ